MAPSSPLLVDLRAAYESGNLIVFAGAGVSAAAGLPTWKGLAQMLLERLRSNHAPAITLGEVEEALRRDQYVDALSAVKLALGPQEFGRVVEQAADDRGHGVPEIAQAIAALKPKLRAILTTNLDRFLERALSGDWESLTAPPGDLAQRRHYILKLHGTLLDRSSWVFSRDQYDHAMFASPQLQTAFGALYRSFPMLFVGSGLADDNPELTFAQVRALSGEQPPTHYALLAEPVPPFRRSKLEAAGLRLVTYPNADGMHDEAIAILRAIAGANPSSSLAVRPAPPASVPVQPASHERRELLPHTSIAELHVAAIHAGLVNSRGALLAGIHPSLIAGFPTAPAPSSQLLEDLTVLNQIERLSDGTVPLSIWLKNALLLAGPRVEAEVFKRALAALGEALAALGEKGTGATGKSRPLVVLGPHIVAEGERVAVSGTTWTVRLYRFLLGDEAALTHIADSSAEYLAGDRCIVLSEPGEARTLVGDLCWRSKGNCIEVEAPVGPMPPKESVVGLEELDVYTLEEVRDAAAAVSILRCLLGTPVGMLEKGVGTWIPHWLQLDGSANRLNDLVEMDILRMSSVPRYDRHLAKTYAPLRFVSKVLFVQSRLDEANTDVIPVDVELLFVGGGSWKGEVEIARQPADLDAQAKALKDLTEQWKRTPRG